MTSGPLGQRIKGLFSSRRGRDLAGRGRRRTGDAGTQRKLQQLITRVTGRGWRR